MNMMIESYWEAHEQDWEELQEALRELEDSEKI